MTRTTRNNPPSARRGQDRNRQPAESGRMEGTYRHALELGKECAARYRRALAKLAQ